MSSYVKSLKWCPVHRVGLLNFSCCMSLNSSYVVMLSLSNRSMSDHGHLISWPFGYSIIFFFSKFTYFERERVNGGEAERESQGVSRLSAESPTWGLNPRTVRSWPELKSRVLKWLLATQVSLLSCFWPLRVLPLWGVVWVDGWVS